MKKMMCIFLIIYIFMLLMPIAAVGISGISEITEIETAKETDVKVENQSGEDIFRVYDKESEKITNMTAEDYIFGVVAAEMPALYETEALKAQAVAAYTYACRKRNQNSSKKYDITTDYTVDQSFKPYEKALKDWGSKGEEYAEKIIDAVKSVAGKKLTYNSEPILAVYHAVSSGQTFSAKAVWGNEIAYLQAASSEGDKLAENYCSKAEFTKAELKKILNITDDTDKIFTSLKADSNGLVETVKVCGEEVSGADIREALDLPSQNFEYALKENKYTFTCYGYGHGVGMSQYGANYMAKQGYTYKEILNHYYNNCTVE